MRKTPSPLVRACLAVCLPALVCLTPRAASASRTAAPDHSTRLQLAPAAAGGQALQTVLSTHGAGTHTTQSFTVPHEWELAWHYDCRKSAGFRTFRVAIRPDDGQSSPFEPISQRGWKGHGTDYYHQTGTFFAVIHTACRWRLRVQTPDQAASAAPSPTPNSPPVTATATPTPTSEPTNTPTPVPGPTTLFSMSATGLQSTPLFTVYGSDWQIQWTYDCSAQGGGAFNLNVYTPDGGDVASGPKATGMGGSGTQDLHQGGTFYVDISSTCSWTVKIVALQGGAPASTPGGSTLLTVQGSGPQTTQTFTTQSNDWQLWWSYDCSTPGGAGNFDIEVHLGNGQFFETPVFETGLSGARTTYVHRAGTFELQIGSTCTWKVEVIG